MCVPYILDNIMREKTDSSFQSLWTPPPPSGPSRCPQHTAEVNQLRFLQGSFTGRQDGPDGRLPGRHAPHSDRCSSLRPTPLLGTLRARAEPCSSHLATWTNGGNHLHTCGHATDPDSPPQIKDHWLYHLCCTTEGLMVITAPV